MRVVREARATGAGSPLSSGGEIRGRRVERASGRRRVRKRVDAWRYVLEIWEGWRDAVVEPSEEEMDEERRLWEKVWEELIVAVGLEEAAREPLRDMVVECQAVDEDNRYDDDDDDDNGDD